MIKLTNDWIRLEGQDRKALTMLLGLDISNVILVCRKQLVTWLATAERISRDSPLHIAAQLDRLVDEADKVGISGL